MSPILKAQNDLKQATKEVQQLRNLLAEKDQLIKLSASVSNAEIKKSLTIAARWELKASMITSLFASEIKQAKDNCDNARTLNELKAWIKEDLIDRWQSFLLGAEMLDDMSKDDFERRAQELTEAVGIQFNADSVKKNFKAILSDYGITE